MKIFSATSCLKELDNDNVSIRSSGDRPPLIVTKATKHYHVRIITFASNAVFILHQQTVLTIPVLLSNFHKTRTVFTTEVKFR